MTTSRSGEFLYRVPGRPASLRPGAHSSRLDGGSGVFLGLQPLLSRPNPRRIDLRRSLTDPFGQWLVRNMSERVSVPLYVVADLSASMATDDKREAIACLVESTGSSAWRTGDPFGFVGADRTVRAEWFRPATHARGAGSRLAELLRAAPYNGDNAAGLLDAMRHLGKRRSLVLLASDFHFDIGTLRALLASLTGHFVVPVVIWGAAESAAHVPDRGLVDLADSENAARRFLWLRPRLAERIRSALRQRRTDLIATFAQFGLRAVFIDDGFDPDHLTHHFLGGTDDAAAVA